MDNFVKNHTFGQKCKIVLKNHNFGQKMDNFVQKCKTVVKNHNFSQEWIILLWIISVNNAKLFSKIIISAKKMDYFVQKCKFLSKIKMWRMRSLPERRLHTRIKRKTKWPKRRINRIIRQIEFLLLALNAYWPYITLKSE